MNKIYLIAPLVGLAVFAPVYWQHARAHERRLVETKQLEAEARIKKARQQQSAQAEAIAAATAATERRSQERAEKQRIDDAQKQARLAAEERRHIAFEQAKRLRARLDRLRSELAAAGDAVNRVEERKRELRQEAEFLAGYVEQAEANRSLFEQLLENLELNERERTAALTPPKAGGR